MDNTHWGLNGEGFEQGHLKNARGTSGRGGWHELNPTGVPTIGGHSRGLEGSRGACISTSGDTSEDTLDDATSQFGRMSLGAGAASVEQLPSARSGPGGVDELAMGSLRVGPPPAGQQLQV